MCGWLNLDVEPPGAEGHLYMIVASSTAMIFIFSHLISKEWLQDTIPFSLDDFKWIFICNEVLYYVLMKLSFHLSFLGHVMNKKRNNTVYNYISN